jgi:hypothetical protein
MTPSTYKRGHSLSKPKGATAAVLVKTHDRRCKARRGELEVPLPIGFQYDTNIDSVVRTPLAARLPECDGPTPTA